MGLNRSKTMVDYIGVNDIQRLVRAIGPAEFIARLADEIEADYARWPEFENSPRLASHSPVGVIELMPATDGKLYSFKYVNGHPKNTSEGLLTVMAFGVLAEVDTGYPLLLSELTVTTALRTAATSAVAARRLARPGSRVMALIGNGAQSEFQAIAFHRLVGIRRLQLFDVDPGASAKLMRNLATMPWLADLEVVHCESTAEACQGADIVTTVTADKRNAVILTPPMIAPGMHINGVGGDCPGKTEMHPDVLRIPGLQVVVEYEAQSRHEGEIQQMPPDYPVIELAQVVRGEVTVRRSASDITLFDSVGYALEDYSALRFLYGLIREQKVGRRKLDLVPELLDPKDLFGGTIGAGRAVSRARTRKIA